MNNVTEITCFIASPSDTSEERNACECVFEEINHGIGRSKGFRLVPLRWEKDVYPGVAEYGQQVINRQVDGNYDLFVGIMKGRFGTPTPQAGSGTEEEFNIAYEKYQTGEIYNIFFYFGIPEKSAYELDLEQFQKVKDFRAKIEKNGVVSMQYQGLDDFKKQLKDNLEEYFVKNKPSTRTKRIQKDKENKIVKSKNAFFDYRKTWEDILQKRNYSKKAVEKIRKDKKLCRFPKVIFPQESLVQQLMTKEPLTEEKAALFSLAVKDIGQIPSYYVNYHKDDVELSKQPVWIRLIEREKTLHGSMDVLSDKDDWAVYEQIQRSLYNLDFAKSKELLCNWNAKDYWSQNKAMGLAVYEDKQKEAQTLLDETIKKEKDPSEKLYEVILANFISRKWPQPYSTDEFWRYGLDGQGDLLNHMMSSLRNKKQKPKRRGWIGSTWNIGNNHGDYVKSLRILQFIIDSGIYVSLPGYITILS